MRLLAAAAASLLLCAEGCTFSSDPPEFPPGTEFAPNGGPLSHIARGQLRRPVSLNPQQHRRRFEIRTFNHFIHPGEPLAASLELDGDIQGVTLTARTDESGILRSSTLSLRHRLSEVWTVDVESSRGEVANVELLIDSVLIAPTSDHPSPPLWTGTEIQIELTEVDPGRRPASEFPTLPRPFWSCLARRLPSPVKVGGSVRLNTAVREDSGWVRLTGEGFQGGTTVQFGRWPAVEIQYVSRTELRARPPILPAGPVQISIENELGGFRGPAALELPLSTAQEELRRPEAVVVADRDRSELYLGSHQSVDVVSVDGLRNRLPLPPGLELRDLLRVREGSAVLLAATSEGVMASARASVSAGWGPFQLVSTGDIYALSEHGLAVVGAVGDDRLYLSQDSGRRFESFVGAESLRDLVMTREPLAPVVILDEGGFIYRGSSAPNGFLNWSFVSAPELVTLVHSPVHCSEWHGLARASPEAPAVAAVSTDNGQTWTRSDVELDGIVAKGLRLFGAGAGAVWTWTGDEWRAVATLPSGEVTALTATELGDRVEVFMGSRHFAVSTQP